MTDTYTSENLFEAKVLTIQDSEEGKIGWVAFHGVRILVNLSLVPGIKVGEKVLVNGRVALSPVEEDL